MTKTEQNVYNMILDTVEGLGYVLYDVEFVKEGKDHFLRVYIDNQKGIDLDDCEKVSNAVDPILDEKDPISTSYSLEVSSCGLERHLREEKHYKMAIGKEIAITLYKAIDGNREIEALLKDVSKNKIVIKAEEKELEIEMSDIASAKILFKWEE